MRIALLVNPAAGRGRAPGYAAVAQDCFLRAGHEVLPLEVTDAEVSAAARAGVAAQADVLVVVGGDGAVHHAVQALAGTSTALGVIPAGTGNDVARYFDLPRRDPRAAAARILAGRPRTVDVAQASDRYFVTVLAAGFDAAVNERANTMTRPSGQLKYTLATLAELRSFRPLTYDLVLDGVAHRVPAMMVSVGNGPSFGGGLRITHGAVLDDGLLDVVVILPMSRPDLIRTYPKLFRGMHVHHPLYRHYRVSSVSIGAPGVVAYADGERLGPLPLQIRCHPGALRVVC